MNYAEYKKEAEKDEDPRQMWLELERIDKHFEDVDPGVLVSDLKECGLGEIEDDSGREREGVDGEEG